MELEFSPVQRAKIKYLLEKGGALLLSCVQVQMPDGSVATIDQYGHVTWAVDKREEANDECGS